VTVTTLLALCAVLFVLWAAGAWVRQRFSPSAGAERLRSHLRAVYATEHELVEVNAANFTHLDLAFYDATTKTLAEQGFRTLGDIEDRTVSRLRTARPTFVRLATNGDSIGAEFYHYRLAGFLRWLLPHRKDIRIVAFSTDLSDGCFLTTSNAWTARHIALPDVFLRAIHPPDTPPLALLEDHRRRVEQYIAAHPNVTPAIAGTLADALASAHRSNRIKGEFRARRDYRVTREELAGIVADRPSPAREQAASDLADAMEGRRADDARQAPQSPWLQALLWLLLVFVFFVCYRWAQH
jgi:hypothetical protein